MIKCNVTVCGVIGRDASVRKNREEKEFMAFPLRVQIPATGGRHTIEVDVRKECSQEEATGYRNGSRVEVRGTMYLKRRGDKLYFNWINKAIWSMDVTASHVPVRPFLEYSGTIYYGLTVNPANGEVYIADAIDYQQQGMIYRYSPEGKLIDEFYVGIIPGAFCWK